MQFHFKQRQLIIPLPLISVPLHVFAASASSKFTDFKSFVSDFAIPHIIQPIVTALYAIAIVVFVWGVIKYILSAGDERARSEGAKLMFHGIFAIFIMVAFWGFVKILRASFGW